ncbi:MAG: carbon-nitrogen hydrolase family protein [Planctomycetota bacterium]|nr:carbon-nitrogen hydrolase family protein [Planctomycetota bacterium]
MAAQVLGGREQVKVAVVQASSVFMNKKGCLEKACDKIIEAGKEGAELIVFPETWIPTYPYWTMGWDTIAHGFHDIMADLQDNSVVVGSEDTEILGRAAKEAGAYVVMGCNELDDRIGSRTLYNSLVYIDKDGSVLGRHRKLIPSFIERIWWGQGDARDLKVYDTDIGRIGGQICWENHIVNITAWYIAQGVDIHVAVWPGLWNCGASEGESFIYAGHDINKCDLIPATRERAFSGQCYVVSANNILKMEDIPDDFPFKDSMTYGGPGQEDFVGWACGGSHIVAPTSEYMVPPTFDVETIIYAELQAKYIKVVKSVFDSLGHYARWDLVNLTTPPQPYEPIAASPVLAPPADVRDRVIENVAREFKLEPERVAEVVRNAM